MKMKISLFVILMALIASQLAPSLASAQTLGTNYVWIEVDTVWTTPGVDTNEVDTTYVLNQRWEELSFWFMDGAGFAKVSGDTSTYVKDWLYLLPGTVITVGPATRVRRLLYRSEIDTVRFFMFGYKKVNQGS